MSKRALRLLGAGALMVFVWAPVAARVAGAQDTYVPNEVLVGFTAGTGRGAIVEAATAVGGTLKHLAPVPNTTLALITLPETTTLTAAIETLQARARVLYAEPNYYVETGNVRPARPHQNTTLRIRTGVDGSGRPTYREAVNPTAGTQVGPFPSENNDYAQWGFYDMGASAIWPAREGTVSVALLDTGVDYSHPETLNRIINGYDFANEDADSRDDNGHGTHMAGIITATPNNRKGISGAARSKVVAIKVLDANGRGTHYSVARGIYKAPGYASKVLLLGFSGPGEGQTLRNAVVWAGKAGCLIVAPAGDTGDSTPQYPAAYADWAMPARPVTLNDRVVAVSAAGAWVTPSGSGEDVFVEHARAAYATFGPWVDLAAPGTDIWSTTPNKRPFTGLDLGDAPDGYNCYSGSSLAAAFTAATAARTWSAAGGLGAIGVKRRLVGTNWKGLKAFTGPVDVDGDGTNEIEASWDPVSATAGASRTNDLMVLNAALSMGRAAVWGRAYDAYTGLGLTGADAKTVWTVVYTAPTMSAKIGADAVPGADTFDILNIPWFGHEYSVRLRKGGYTNGFIGVARLVVDGSQPYYHIDDVAVPPTGTSYNFVANWSDGTPSYVELDAHVLQPLGGASNSDVGPAPALASDPTYFLGNGSLTRRPFTQLMLNSATVGANMETIALAPPLYDTTRFPYHFFLVNRDTRTPTTGFATARLWAGGVQWVAVRLGVGTVMQSEPACTFEGGGANCSTWLVATMTSSKVKVFPNVVGDGVNSAAPPF